jgi:hypothetical protein
MMVMMVMMRRRRRDESVKVDEGKGRSEVYKTQHIELVSNKRNNLPSCSGRCCFGHTSNQNENK